MTPDHSVGPFVVVVVAIIIISITTSSTLRMRYLNPRVFIGKEIK